MRTCSNAMHASYTGCSTAQRSMPLIHLANGVLVFVDISDGQGSEPDDEARNDIQHSVQRGHDDGERPRDSGNTHSHKQQHTARQQSMQCEMPYWMP